jgi:hypothetical protein
MKDLYRYLIDFIVSLGSIAIFIGALSLNMWKLAEYSTNLRASN